MLDFAVKSVINVATELCLKPKDSLMEKVKIKNITVLW